MTNGTIIDTSVWIDYLNDKACDKTDLADKLLEQRSVIILPIILQEILQGIRDRQMFETIKESLLSLNLLQYNPIETAIGAASLYRFLKRKGITIRKPNDCLIGVICINNNLPLLHNDKDFDNIAKHTSLKIYKPKNGKN